MNIYHRIYKLYQRKISAQQIAATTHMPLQSVREIIKKFESKNSGTGKKKSVPELEAYLDYHISRHNKYTILDFSGFFTEEFGTVIKGAIEEVRMQVGLALAIKMEGVLFVDEQSMNALIKFNKDLVNIAKSLVILSPSDVVEEYIQEKHVENSLHVFGTLSAFEEHALNLSHGK